MLPVMAAIIGMARSDGSSWAVVTGASTGLGEAIAREVASRQYNVLLTARRHEKLTKLAAEIESTHGVQTAVAVCDLSTGLAGAEAVHRASSRLPGSVDFVAVNAGFAAEGGLVEMAGSTLEDMLEVNVVSTARLCQLYAADFVQNAGEGRRRRGGKILVSGSIIASSAVPFAATYAASKAFVRSFTRALRAEVRRAGVTVTLLEPGAIATDFASTTGNSRALVFSMPGARALGVLQTPDAVARRAVARCIAGASGVTPGPVNCLWTRLAPLLPARLSQGCASGAFCSPGVGRWW